MDTVELYLKNKSRDLDGQIPELNLADVFARANQLRMARHRRVKILIKTSGAALVLCIAALLFPGNRQVLAESMSEVGRQLMTTLLSHSEAHQSTFIRNSAQCPLVASRDVRGVRSLICTKFVGETTVWEMAADTKNGSIVIRIVRAHSEKIGLLPFIAEPGVYKIVGTRDIGAFRATAFATGPSRNNAATLLRGLQQR